MKKFATAFTAFVMLLGQALSITNVFATSVTNVPVHYEYTGGCAEINIGGADLPIGPADECSWDPEQPDGTMDETINYSYDSTVRVELQTMFIDRLTSIKINGTEYNTHANFPNTPAKLLDAIKDEHIHYVFDDVPYSPTGYTIETTRAKNTGEWLVAGNFLWSYLDQDKGHDSYVGNGKLTIESVKYQGTTYYSENEVPDAMKKYMNWHEFNAGQEGSAFLPTGAEVTVKLIPNAGYQLTSFGINGGEFAPQAQIGTYVFDMRGGTAHLWANFARVNDAVETVADVITAGNITLGSGEIANGTARLDVSNATNLDPTEISGFEQNAGNYNVKSILDISLYKTIYKGKPTEAWDTQIRDLQNEATITLQLDESVDGNDIVIIHEKHDGTYEVIPTTYDPVAHTITFRTSSFSNYAIATRTIGSPDTGVMTKENASASENTDVTIQILGTLALWGLVAFIAKKGLA